MLVFEFEDDTTLSIIMVLGDANTNQNQSVRSNPFLLYDADQPGQSLIKTQLWNLKQQDMDINKYFTRFITLWNELKYYKPPMVCNCGGAKEALEKYEQEECLTQFLHGVKQSHRQTIDMILTKEPLPDVYWALKCLECEESRRPIDDYRTLFMERRRF
ncbi:unnamed protein product [Arabidopsis thaliana]|uniref:(thale cress) hypothetical protein n=1 Tax=Arabidopsis thaliana TaxID=3702 RepID=A0A7G2FG85_ARATH|nr:unnamed protein product [Arabidopsis thaliana]